MSRNSNAYNEQMMLIDILNSMHNNNLTQINNLTNSISNLTSSINNLVDNNAQIRNLHLQILYSQNRQNVNNFSRNNQRNTSTRENNNQSGIGSSILNNTPYIIDSVQELRFPSNRNSRNATQNNNFSQLLQTFFEPVIVFPTQSQMESATRRVRYCDIVTPRNRSCPISLENFNDTDMVTVVRQCGHIFNSEELYTWFRSNSRCPVCRYDIRSYNANASSEFFQNNSPIPSIPSNPLNDEELNISDTSVERNRTENNESYTNAASNILNNFINNIANDYNLNNSENLESILTDSSGNYLNDASDPVAIFRLITELNNRNPI